jgi:bifunctional DNA-binding transcriptional regulator/antitoxin component of YhaV-PrlF toxin-antitoxin module
MNLVCQEVTTKLSGLAAQGEATRRPAKLELGSIAVILFDGNTAVKDTCDMIRSERFHGYLAVQGRGTVSLPPELRKKYQLDQAGAQVEITEREDGVLELRAVLPIPATEAWFWEERWNAGEREVDEYVRKGEITVSETVDDFVADLTALSKAKA